MKPDEGGTSDPYLYLLSGTASSGTEYNGLTPLTDQIVPKQSFKMRIGGLSNGGIQSFEGYFIVALTDASGNIKDYVSGSQYYDVTKPLSWRGYSSVDCLLSIYPRVGDRLRLFFCSEKEINMSPVPWKPVLWDTTDGVVGEILLSDNQTLAEVTSIKYSQGTGLLVLDTKDGVTLKVEGGTIPDEAITTSVTQLVFDTSLITKGSYKLLLTRDKDKLELKFDMGKK